MVFNAYNGKPEKLGFPAYSRRIGIKLATLREAVSSQAPLNRVANEKVQKFMGNKKDYSELTPDQLIRCFDERIIQLYYLDFFDKKGKSKFQAELFKKQKKGGV